MKKIIIFFLLILATPCYSDQFIGILEGIRQDSTGLYISYDSTNYFIINTAMYDFVMDVYNTGIEVVVDYDGSNQVNFLYTSSASGYPLDDLSQIFSFMLGGLACAAFVIGIKIKFT